MYKLAIKLVCSNEPVIIEGYQAAVVMSMLETGVDIPQLSLARS